VPSPTGGSPISSSCFGRADRHGYFFDEPPLVIVTRLSPPRHTLTFARSASSTGRIDTERHEEQNMIRIAIILGSTRPNRNGAQVADWVSSVAATRTDADFELIDLRDHQLPHLDEPLSPLLGRYQNAHTQAWARTIARFDGFVFVTAEYNHGLPGSLKDAIDYLGAEWANKAAGIVSYGVAGGTGAAFQLRQICGQLGIADVSQQLPLNLRFEFENYSVFKSTAAHAVGLNTLLDQLIAWSTALAPLRAVSSVSSEASSQVASEGSSEDSAEGSAEGSSEGSAERMVEPAGR
jgi:NAD(P)H-dependent FMN reductase